MKRTLIRRLLAGAAAGVLWVCGASLLLSLFAGMPRCAVSVYLENRFGFRLALLLELLFCAAAGAVLSAAALLRRAPRLPELLRTILHLTVSALTLYLWGTLHTVNPSPEGFLLLAGLAVGICLLALCVNSLGCQSDVECIRAALGLPEPVSAGGPLQLRPILPYLLMMAAAELALPPLMRLLDPADVPVLTGMLYPFVFLPFACFFTGLGAGRRHGIALLLPVVCALCVLPHIFWLYNSTALFQVWLAGGAALIGNLLGALLRKYRKKVS